MEETKVPSWLTKIQNNSWEPEIIISGFSIAFFFLLPRYLYNFAGMLIQDFGADSLLIFIQYAIMIFIVTSLKILFIGHLILRGLWAGLVGLSYVFPKGINKERLEKDIKDFSYKKPIDLVIEIEKICSLIFSFAFMIIMNLIKVMAFYFIAIAGNIFFYLFNFNSAQIQVAQLSFLGIVMVVFIIYAVLKKEKGLEEFATSVSSNLMYTFFTNISKKKMIFVQLALVAIIIPLSFLSIAKFKFDVQKEKRIKDSYLTYIDQNNYLEDKNDELRVQRAIINSFLIENCALELNISTYKRDKSLIRDIQTNQEKFLQFLPNVNINQLNRSDIYQVYIDDQLIDIKDWIMKKDTGNSQKFITTYIPVNNISSGIHKLRIKRAKWSKKEKDFKFIENWVVIPFKIL